NKNNNNSNSNHLNDNNDNDNNNNYNSNNNGNNNNNNNNKDNKNIHIDANEDNQWNTANVVGLVATKDLADTDHLQNEGDNRKASDQSKVEINSNFGALPTQDVSVPTSTAAAATTTTTTDTQEQANTSTECYLMRVLRERYEKRRKEYKHRLTRVYSQKNKEQLPNIDKLLDRSKGQFHPLYEKICNKYSLVPLSEWDGQDESLLDTDVEIPRSEIDNSSSAITAAAVASATAATATAATAAAAADDDGSSTNQKEQFQQRREKTQAQEHVSYFDQQEQVQEQEQKRDQEDDSEKEKEKEKKKTKKNKKEEKKEKENEKEQEKEKEYISGEAFETNKEDKTTFESDKQADNWSASSNAFDTNFSFPTEGQEFQFSNEQPSETTNKEDKNTADKGETKTEPKAAVTVATTTTDAWNWNTGNSSIAGTMDWNNKPSSDWPSPFSNESTANTKPNSEDKTPKGATTDLALSNTSSAAAAAANGELSNSKSSTDAGPSWRDEGWGKSTQESTSTASTSSRWNWDATTDKPNQDKPVTDPGWGKPTSESPVWETWGSKEQSNSSNPTTWNTSTTGPDPKWTDPTWSTQAPAPAPFWGTNSGGQSQFNSGGQSQFNSGGQSQFNSGGQPQFASGGNQGNNEQNRGWGTEFRFNPGEQQPLKIPPQRKIVRGKRRIK
ncbi:U box domain-containing protein, partial [Reticulomyxa filosa]